jgi:hypothetical protein
MRSTRDGKSPDTLALITTVEKNSMRVQYKCDDSRGHHKRDATRSGQHSQDLLNLLYVNSRAGNETYFKSGHVAMRVMYAMTSMHPFCHEMLFQAEIKHFSATRVSKKKLTSTFDFNLHPTSKNSRFMAVLNNYLWGTLFQTAKR